MTVTPEVAAMREKLLDALENGLPDVHFFMPLWTEPASACIGGHLQMLSGKGVLDQCSTVGVREHTWSDVCYPRGYEDMSDVTGKQAAEVCRYVFANPDASEEEINAAWNRARGLE